VCFVYLDPKLDLPCPVDPYNKNPDSWGRDIARCWPRFSDEDTTYWLAKAQDLVPFRSLGLSENLVKDGYGRYFTYAVNGYFTQHT